MKTQKMQIIALLLIFASAGCATSNFRPYVGAQQNWPTASGSFAETEHAVPAYFGLPDRPYVILGYIDATTAPIRRSGVVKYAAARAKELGGDAIIVMSEGSEYRGTYGTASTQTNTHVSGYTSGNTFQGTGTSTTSHSSASIPMYAGKAAVVVIKFK